MSLPATRLALPNVDTARDQGPRPAACADSQVRGLLRCGEPQYGKVRTHDVRSLQCRDLPGLPQATAAASASRPPHGAGTGQRPRSPRRTPRSIPSPLRSAHQALVPAALQSTTRPHRTSLEARPTARHSQSLLRYTPRGPGSHRRLLRSLAKTQSGVAATMLHYLGRYV